MLYIYILLAIIAVGVLLVSKEGKKILSIVAGMGMIGLVLCLIVWYVVPAFSQYFSQYWEDIKVILIVVLICAPISIVVASLCGSKKIATPLMSVKIKLQKMWRKICNIYEKSPILFIFYLLGACILIAIMAQGILWALS
jgi:hypothetical protein